MSRCIFQLFVVPWRLANERFKKSFRKVHDLPPCRHLRMLRLSQARRALLSADCELATVTAIATYFGFLELERFSVQYWKVFGESPSQTPHHVSRIFPPQTRSAILPILASARDDAGVCGICVCTFSVADWSVASGQQERPTFSAGRFFFIRVSGAW
jgi:AraC-like DNA-binding protein